MKSAIKNEVSCNLGSKGFTLIELLVVISIIGLLSSVVLVAINGARIKARDAKRKSDFHQIAQALEIYYDRVGGYPAMGWTSATVAGGHSALSNPTCAGNNCDWANLVGPLVSQGIVSALPGDPLNKPTGCFPFSVSANCPSGFNMNYLYHYYSDGTFPNSDARHYILCTWLENPSDSNGLQFKDVADPFATTTTYLHANDNYSGYNYCLTQ